MLHTTTNSGLHDFVGERVLARYARPGVQGVNRSANDGTALLGDSNIFVLDTRP